jgi:hypothetical protein
VYVRLAPQELRESVPAGGSRHRVWQRVVQALARLAPADEDMPLATNLLVGLFAAGELAVEADVDRRLAQWQGARQRGLEVA